MRNNELHIPVAMTSGGVYACFMNGRGAVGLAALPIFSRVNCFFFLLRVGMRRSVRSSCQRRTAAITAHEERMPKWEPGFIHMGHVRLAPHRRRDPHAKHAAPELGSRFTPSDRVGRRERTSAHDAERPSGTPGRGKRASATPAFPDPDPELSRDPSRCCRRHFRASKASSCPTLPPMTSSPPTQSRLTLRQVEIIPP